MYESWSSGWGRSWGRSVMIPTPKLRVDGPPRSKSNPKPPFCYCSSSEESPRWSLPSLIYRAWSLRMTYTNDARVASSNVTHHHRLLAWETSGGKLGTLASYRHVRAILPNFETLDPWVAGQQAAHDTLPQALWHDLMMTALLKQMRIHRSTNRKMWKSIINPLCEVQGADSIWAQPQLS